MQKIQRFTRPEFQEKLARARQYQRRPDKTLINFWFVALPGFFFLLLVYFLMISPLFLVKSAILNAPGAKSQEVDDALERMGEKRIYLIPENHILILNKRNLERTLQNELPAIKEVSSFKKIFPNKIEISFVMRKPLYVWQSGNEHYLLDQEGVVFQRIANYAPTAFSEILINDLTAREVAVGEKLDVEKILGFVAVLKKQWPSSVPQTNYVSFSVPGNKSLDLFAQTGFGFEVYFDLEGEVSVQLLSLKLLLDREIKPETLNGLAYIDLRLPNVAYYCYKDAPCALGKE